MPQLARRCGLHAAEATTGTAGDRSFLPVKRYDRLQRDGAVRRIRQEDFCRALGRPPGSKYEPNQTGVPGPSLAEMFALIREHMTARDTNRFLGAAIFNVAVGNVDSHSKNYAVLLQPGRVERAPLYDLMSGLASANIKGNHAQSTGGQRRGRYIFRRHGQRLAEAAGLSAPAVLRRVVSLCDRIGAKLPQARQDVIAMPAGKGELLDTFCTEIAARVATVRINAGTNEPDSQPGAPEGSDIPGRSPGSCQAPA
jgi:serine/threonine-protein kinase HipA